MTAFARQIQKNLEAWITASAWNTVVERCRGLQLQIEKHARPLRTLWMEFDV